MKNNKVNSKTYFSNLKLTASTQLFNLEKSGLNSLDPEIIKIALKNLVFYADKKLEKMDSKKESK